MASTLCNTDFPPYTVCMLDDVNFLVAGGGGPVRSGVPNAIEVFELFGTKKSVSAVSAYRYDTDMSTDRSAIMNSAITADGENSCLLATGKDEFCQLYRVKKEKESDETSDEQELRKRKGKEDKKTKDDIDTEDLYQFIIERLKSTQTDFNESEQYQKAVRFVPEKSLLVTGGVDGYLRFWKHPNLSKELEIEAHSKEIDDLDVSPSGDKVVSVSRDCKAFVWNTKDGSQSHALYWKQNTEEKAYRFRSCRFGIVENNVKNTKLFTIHVPHVQGKSNTQCYITKWDTKHFSEEKTVSTGTDVLSALAVSADGNYLGLGTMSGAVAVYVAFSLQKLQWVKDVHGIFVTGLSFVPLTERNSKILGEKDCALISISVDKQCKMVRVNKRSEYPIILMLLGFLAIIVGIFFLSDYLGYPL
ncbi:guanine nucleotide-exchange factor SEC12-like [Ptychodera flava]|uniref:guanine nucleotide-exchange factor SEC12-like n=1 Tax=Ptychodera flava TaxID=63121 RepID=UPI003969DAC1